MQHDSGLCKRPIKSWQCWHLLDVFTDCEQGLVYCLYQAGKGHDGSLERLWTPLFDFWAGILLPLNNRQLFYNPWPMCISCLVMGESERSAWGKSSVSAGQKGWIDFYCVRACVRPCCSHTVFEMIVTIVPLKSVWLCQWMFANLLWMSVDLAWLCQTDYSVLHHKKCRYIYFLISNDL